MSENSSDNNPDTDFEPNSDSGSTKLSRRDFRALVFHLLYAWDASGYDSSLSAVIDTFNRGFELDIPLEGEVADTVQNIANSREEVDAIVKPLLKNWTLDRIGYLTRIILWMAVWELLKTDIPSVIIINEAVELAKNFSEKDAYKFINGILDEVVKSLPNRNGDKTS
jgi:transcription antitermination protein NusB